MILTGRQILARNIFTPQTVRTVHEATGLTGGASFCGYDVHLREDFVLEPGDFVLGSTLEHMTMPNDLVGFVQDKSSLARLGIHAGQGVIEPGWSGFVTIEIANHSKETRRLIAGQPIAQIMLHRLDTDLDSAYDGRYQNQGPEPTMAKVKKV